MKLYVRFLLLALIAMTGACMAMPSLAQTPKNLPGQIAVDDSGNVYVTMHAGSALPLGVYAYAPNGTTIGAYPLEMCYGIVIGNDGQIYVSNPRGKGIDRLEKNGSFSAVWWHDDPERQYSSIAVDSAGNLYIEELNIPVPPDFNLTGRILKLSPDGRVLETIEGSPVVPLNRFVTMSISGNGTIYIADTGPCIMAIYPDGGRSKLTPAGTGINTSNRLYYVAAGSDGYLYVTSHTPNCVYRVAENGTVVATWDGCGPDRFVTPGAITTDGKGRVYVNDLWGGRITWFDASRYHFGEDLAENTAGKGVLWDNAIIFEGVDTQPDQGYYIVPWQGTPVYIVVIVVGVLGLAGVFLYLRGARR